MTKKMERDIVEIKVSVAKIEQHLKDTNGSLLRHEKNIEATNLQVDRNTINISKMLGMMAVAGGVGGLIAIIVSGLM
jgi:ferritin-like metal-binding protein YciE